jgi:hypothetical protein
MTDFEHEHEQEHEHEEAEPTHLRPAKRDYGVVRAGAEAPAE